MLNSAYLLKHELQFELGITGKIVLSFMAIRFSVLYKWAVDLLIAQQTHLYKLIAQETHLHMRNT